MTNPTSRLTVRRSGSLPAVLAMAALLAVVGAACSPAAPSASPAAIPTTSPTVTLAPSPAVTPSPMPTPLVTTSAGTPACAVADLKASHGPVEGAAGSTLTEVLLVSAVACAIDAFPALGLRDGTGAPLVGAPSAGPGRLDLAAGAAYSSQVRLANWCAPEPAFPLTLEIVLGDAELVVTGTSFPEEGGLPPCNGDGGPILEGTAWTASP